MGYSILYNMTYQNILELSIDCIFVLSSFWILYSGFFERLVK